MGDSARIGLFTKYASPVPFPFFGGPAAAHWGGLLFDTKKPGRAFVPQRLKLDFTIIVVNNAASGYIKALPTSPRRTMRGSPGRWA